MTLPAAFVSKRGLCLYTGKAGIGMHNPHWKQTQAFTVAPLHMWQGSRKNHITVSEASENCHRLGYSRRLTLLNNVSSTDGWKVCSRLVRILCTTLDRGTRFWQASRDSFKEWSRGLVWMSSHRAESSLSVVFYIVRKLLWGLLRMAKWVQALAVKLDLSLIPVIWRVEGEHKFYRVSFSLHLHTMAHAHLAPK